MGKRVTLREVAKACGVSLSSASYALRDDPNIAPATRARIKQKAQELGYRPHLGYAAIAHHRHADDAGEEVIAVVREEGHQYGFDEAYFEPVTNWAAEIGCRTDGFLLGPQMSGERLSRILLARGIRMVLFAGPFYQEYPGFAFEQFIAVACQEGRWSIPVDHVEVDQFRAAELAWQKVWDAGWRRIGVYHPYDPPAPARLDRVRLAAFEYLQKNWQTPDERVPICSGPVVNGERVFREWFREYRPEAVISFLASPFSYPPPYFDDESLPPFVALRNRGNNPNLAGLQTPTLAIFRDAILWLGRKRRLAYSRDREIHRDLLLPPIWHDAPSLWPKSPEA